MTGREAAEAVKRGEESAQAIWNEFGNHFGNMVKTVMFAYDPEAIILGGGISEAYPYFEKSMWNAIQSFPYAESVRNLRILVSGNENISLLGASALINNL